VPDNDLFFIKPRSRHLLDTGVVETDQPLLPFTGRDHSGPAMHSAVDFWIHHSHPDWHERAKCKDSDQEVFYGEEDRAGKARHHPNLTVDEVARARRICNACPVQMECLTHAIVEREEFGIWGGSTAGQRKRWIKAYEEQQNVLDFGRGTEDEVFGGWLDDFDDNEDTIAG
jgi:hypothetical protein